MAKTLEEIKGMNIPVGAPIEMAISKACGKYKQIGYFDELIKDLGEGEDYDESFNKVMYHTNFLEKKIEYLKNIESITILTPQNEIPKSEFDDLRTNRILIR